MELYQHQKRILEDSPNKSLLALDTGLGKSFLALELAKNKESQPVLIVCPKALAKNWEREIGKADFPLRYKVMTKETFRRDWDMLAFHPTIIYDEAHFVAGLTSQMSKNFYKYLKKWNIPHRYLLTATPYMSTPWNIYTLARHLGYDLGYNYFKRKFFTEIQMGGRMIPMARKNMEEELKSIIQNIGYTYTIDECFDVPE